MGLILWFSINYLYALLHTGCKFSEFFLKHLKFEQKKCTMALFCAFFKRFALSLYNIGCISA